MYINTANNTAVAGVEPVDIRESVIIAANSPKSQMKTINEVRYIRIYAGCFFLFTNNIRALHQL